MTTPYHQEEIPLVTTPEDDEEITGVVQNTEDPGVSINNSMPGNPPEPTSTNDNNMPKLEAVGDSDTKEDEN